MIAWCLVLFKENVDGIRFRKVHTCTSLPPLSQSLFLVHFLLIIFLFVFPQMSYTQLVDLENVVNCYFKKNANDSEFLVFFNQQEEEILNRSPRNRKPRREWKNLKNLTCDFSLPPLPLQVWVLGEDLAHLGLKFKNLQMYHHQQVPAEHSPM